MRKFFFVLFVIIVSTINSQAQNANPCSSPQCNQFDFWVGSWNLTYNDTSHATNTITKDFDSCVIHEHFYDEATKLHGESWSVYNPLKKQWQQTWVDTQGSYITLTGSFENNKMTLLTQPLTKPNGTSMQYRMLYYNITKDSFDWDWSSSTDGGATWKSSWLIHYSRKK
jgi:hypothetical protein